MVSLLRAPTVCIFRLHACESCVPGTASMESCGPHSTQRLCLLSVPSQLVHLQARRCCDCLAPFCLAFSTPSFPVCRCAPREGG